MFKPKTKTTYKTINACLLIAFFLLMTSSSSDLSILSMREQREEIDKFRNIGSHNPIFESNGEGKLSNSMFEFEDENWVLEISKGTFNHTSSGCNFHLKYYSDRERLLVRPFQNNKTILKGDFMLFLKKGDSVFINLDVPFESKTLDIMEPKYCHVGTFKGVECIRPIVREIHSNKKNPEFLREFLDFGLLPFLKNNFDSFNLKDFRNFTLVWNESEKYKLLSALKKTKKNEVSFISNEDENNKFKDSSVEKYNQWKKDLNSFCETFGPPQGKRLFCTLI